MGGRLKSFLKSALPAGVPVYRRIRTLGRSLISPPPDVEKVFTDIYRNNSWADLVLCRDCFIHLSFRHARAAVENFKRSGSTYLLATTHAAERENVDIESGGGHLVNLRLPPFDFPRPLRLIEEDPEPGKRLGRWRLKDL